MTYVQPALIIVVGGFLSFSSGTTGLPKAVSTLHTRQDRLANAITRS